MKYIIILVLVFAGYSSLGQQKDSITKKVKDTVKVKLLIAVAKCNCPEEDIYAYGWAVYDTYYSPKLRKPVRLFYKILKKDKKTTTDDYMSFKKYNWK